MTAHGGTCSTAHLNALECTRVRVCARTLDTTASCFWRQDRAKEKKQAVQAQLAAAAELEEQTKVREKQRQLELAHKKAQERARQHTEQATAARAEKEKQQKEVMRQCVAHRWARTSHGVPLPLAGPDSICTPTLTTHCSPRTAFAFVHPGPGKSSEKPSISARQMKML